MDEENKEIRQNIKSFIRKNGKPLAVRDNRDRFFFPKEWMKFSDQLKKKQKITFECLINTGARINEIRNIRVNDIDLERKRIILRVTKVKSRFGEKNPRPRIIPISTQFTKYLRRLISERSLKAEDKFNLLSTPAANIAMKKALQKAGIKDWYMFSIHNIRKTLETWLMALNVDSLKLIAHFGHDIKTAARHYVSPDIFSWEEKGKMRMIIGDLYQR